MSNKIKNRMLDWKDRQLMSLGKWLIKIASKRIINKDNFKQICEATNNIDNIHVSKELMDEYNRIQKIINHPDYII